METTQRQGIHWERHRSPTRYGEWRTTKNIIVLFIYFFIYRPGCSDAPDFGGSVSAIRSFLLEDIPRHPDTGTHTPFRGSEGV